MTKVLLVPHILLFILLVEPPINISKRSGGGRGFTGSEFLKKIAVKEGGRGEGGWVGCSFYIKNKLKFEIFHDKKVYSKNVFLCHFSGLRTKDFNIMRVNEKFDFSKRVQEKKQYIWGIP